MLTCLSLQPCEAQSPLRPSAEDAEARLVLRLAGFVPQLQPFPGDVGGCSPGKQKDWNFCLDRAVKPFLNKAPPAS